MNQLNEVREASAEYLAAGELVPRGYKKTEVGVIPEDWEVASLAELGKFKNGVNKNSDAFGHGHPFVNLMDVFGIPSISITDTLGLVASTTIDRKIYDLDEGDVLFVRSSVKPSGVGLTTVIERRLIDAVFSGFLIRYRANGKLTNEFKKFCFYDERFRRRLISSSSVSANTNISQDSLKQLTIAFPSLREEQTAIANGLSDVDALITSLEKLIAKKQAVKTATMQQLLTGKTRLPQFALRTDGTPKGTKHSELGEIPEDWEVQPLASLLNEKPKYGINAAAVALQSNLPVYIRITDISDEGYFTPSEKVGVSSPFSGLYKLKLGDIVLARTGASVGKSYFYRESDGELVYAGFLIKVSPDKSKLSAEYLFQYLKAEKYWAWVTINSMRSGQPGINGNEYGQLQIPTPAIEEQIAIAAILSDMDTEIQTLQQRLNKTRQIKQGMMQELLTGKTRLVKPQAQGNKK